MGFSAAAGGDALAKGAESGGLFGLGKGAEAAGGALAPAAIGEGAAASAPLDLLSFGTAAGTAAPTALGGIGSAATALGTDALGAGAIGGLGGDLLAGGGGADVGAGGVIGANAASPLDTAPYPAGPVSAPTASPLPAGGGNSALAFAGPSGIDATPSIGPGIGPGDAAGAGVGDASGGGGIASFFGNNKGLLTSLGLPLAATVASPALSKLITGVPQQKQLEALAAEEAALGQQQGAYGQQLQQPLLTGKLPPQAQTAVDTATNDAISSTKARYANLGLTGSTAEADAIANIENQKSTITFQIAEQMAQTGGAAITTAANSLNLQDQVYTQLMQAQVSQDNNLQSAIARFAAASAIGSGSKAAGAVNALA